MSLRDRIQDDMKSAMRAKDKERLAAIRLILAAIKQREIDERTSSLEDAQTIAVLERMIKQRRESISHFQSAGREDLAAKEAFEIDVIQSYMPEALSAAEIDTLIDQAIVASGAQNLRDMGKVMGLLKNQLQGRADLGTISTLVKGRLVS